MPWVLEHRDDIGKYTTAFGSILTTLSDLRRVAPNLYDVLVGSFFKQLMGDVPASAATGLKVARVVGEMLVRFGKPTLARINGPTGDANWGHRMVVGDFDGDGDDDIAVSSPANETVTAYINDNANNFTEVDVPAPVDAGEFGAVVADGLI